MIKNSRLVVFFLTTLQMFYAPVYLLACFLRRVEGNSFSIGKEFSFFSPLAFARKCSSRLIFCGLKTICLVYEFLFIIGFVCLFFVLYLS